MRDDSKFLSFFYLSSFSSVFLSLNHKKIHLNFTNAGVFKVLNENCKPNKTHQLDKIMYYFVYFIGY